MSSCLSCLESGVVLLSDTETMFETSPISLCLSGLGRGNFIPVVVTLGDFRFVTDTAATLVSTRGKKAMPMAQSFLAAMLLLQPHPGKIIMHITTSDAVDFARLVAADEGYDVADSNTYYFDLLGLDGRRPLKGYVSIGFYVGGSIRSSISISETTGQAIDMNSCEIFDYPNLLPFQERMMRLSKAKRKTARELADEAGCESPTVLNEPARRPKHN